MAEVIKRDGKPPLGVTFWAQFYEQRIPRLEVFRYVGRQTSTGIYYFQSVREKTLMGRSFYQLNTNGFRPFCIDFQKMLEATDNANS